MIIYIGGDNNEQQFIYIPPHCLSSSTPPTGVPSRLNQFTEISNLFMSRHSCNFFENGLINNKF